MIEKLLVSTAAATDTFTDPPTARLFPQEEPFVARAVPKRRAEFTSGRWCARRALHALGMPAQPIPRGERGMPEWPSGVVGSITHCAGYRAAAVAAQQDLAALGIDAEPHEPLPAGVLDVATTTRERAAGTTFSQTHPHICWDRLIFSAKESVFKTWYPLARTELDFTDVEITPRAESFTARSRVSDPTGRVPSTLYGRWSVENGFVLTAVVLTTRHPRQVSTDPGQARDTRPTEISRT